MLHHAHGRAAHHLSPFEEQALHQFTPLVGGLPAQCVPHHGLRRREFCLVVQGRPEGVQFGVHHVVKHVGLSLVADFAPLALATDAHEQDLIADPVVWVLQPLNDVVNGHVSARGQQDALATFDGLED